MSLTERHAVNGTATVSRPDADPSANGLRASRHSGVSCGNGDSVAENDRQHLLDSARAQGILPADSLIAPPLPTICDFRTLIGQVLAPNISNDLASAPFIEPIEPCDGDLDGTQRDAVARAVHSSDLLLIQGLPGCGKSRVIAEIIRQMAMRGKRVLFVAPDGGAIDVVLQRLGIATPVAPVRLLGRAERFDDLPPGIADLTAVVQVRVHRADWLAKAIEIERAAVVRLDRWRELSPIWAGMLELADFNHQREREQEVIRHRREAIPSEVCRVAEHLHPVANGDPFNDSLHECERAAEELATEFEARRTQLLTERLQAEAELQQARAECESLRPLDEAGHSGRFWSVNFWKAKLNKSLANQVAAIESRIDEKEKDLTRLAEREVALNDDLRQAENDADREHVRIVDEEIKRALAHLDEREAELQRLDNETREKFQLLCDALPAGMTIPGSLAIDSIRSSQQAAAVELRDRESEAEFARRWRDFVETDGNLLAKKWRGQINLVAAPLSALTSDPWFADSAEPFDLLIVDEAHGAIESDLLPAAKKAQRWVLVGEPGQPARLSNGPDACKTKTAPDYFARLWERLHHETWTRDGDRICCHLNPTATADRRRLETEVVADRPDIELRILNPALGESILVEVLFPASMKPVETHGYLFQELGEIPCPSRIRTASWERTGDYLMYRLGPIPALPLPVQSIVLAPGITLRMHDRSADPGQDEIVILFNELEGWDKSRAAAWINGNLRMRDSGRTCRLETSYRHSPALAAWLNEAVNCGCRYPVEQHPEGAIQFEPVPRRAPAGRRRGGAGLEIDLADPSQRELLPNELAATLPSHGYVNLPEAQAIAEFLQRLPAELALAVSAPYPAQVMVLRHYIKDRARVLLPSELSRHECDVLIVSLTRSHVARAVTYGNDPATMLQMLTRPRCRLVLVGDPGTLARRAQWEGAIENLDESTGERERRWVNALLSLSPVRNNRPLRVAEGVKA